MHAEDADAVGSLLLRRGGVRWSLASRLGPTDGDVSILRMSKKAYFEMLRRNQDAALEVIKYQGNRLMEYHEKAKDLALDRADQRLASLLVDLATRNGIKDPNGIRLTIRMTRQDMANYEGVGQAVTKLGDFFRFCNEERRHQALAYRTPAEVCKAA